MHTVSRKRRTMAVLAVVVLVAVAGAGMAHAVVIRDYNLNLPPFGVTIYSCPSAKATASLYAEDQNSFIEPGTLGPNRVRTRLVQDNPARTRATGIALIRSGQDVNLRFLAGQNVPGRSFRLAQDVTIIGCQLQWTTSRGRWSPDRF